MDLELLHKKSVQDFHLIMIFLMEFLTIKICQSLRPKSNYRIPQLIFNIIKQCWDSDPLKRPKTKVLHGLLYDLWY